MWMIYIERHKEAGNYQSAITLARTAEAFNKGDRALQRTIRNLVLAVMIRGVHEGRGKEESETEDVEHFCAEIKSTV